MKKFKTITRYHANGNKSMEYSVDKKNRIQGPYMLWYENGNIEFFGSYINGKPVFSSTTYHENGSVKENIKYLDNNAGDNYKIWIVMSVVLFYYLTVFYYFSDK